MIFFAFWLLTAFLSLVLSSIELPAWVEWSSPAWLVLWMCFWAFVRPIKNQLIGLAVISLIADELLQYNLGAHLLALVPPAFFILYLYNRIRVMSDFQKLFIVLLSALWFHFVLFGINSQWSNIISLSTFFSVVMTNVVWFFYYYLLQLLVGKVSKTSWQ